MQRQAAEKPAQALRVTIYIGEGDRHQGSPLYMAILELLRKEGAAGATVTRGLAGFGAHGRIHTANIEALSTDLPVRIEWIDLAERVERVLPGLRRLVNDGLITQEQIDVVQYSLGQSQDPLDQPLRTIMRSQVVTVEPDAPLAQVIALLLEAGVRCLPVVNTERRLLGIITDGDLLRRAGLSARLGLQSDSLAPAAAYNAPATAADIMTRAVITVQANDPIRSAVAHMARDQLKRLPVVNEQEELLGLVSRIDIFRAVERHPGVAGADEAPRMGSAVVELMVRDVPTVKPDARLDEIVAALEQSQRRRVVVVDAERRVVGIITDGDLLRRSQQVRHPGLLARLRRLVTGEAEISAALPDANERAAELMSAPVITVQPETSLLEALRLMTRYAIKRIPVVDSDGRLVGLLGRASVLRGLLAQPETKSETEGVE